MHKHNVLKLSAEAIRDYNIHQQINCVCENKGIFTFAVYYLKVEFVSYQCQCVLFKNRKCLILNVNQIFTSKYI